MRKARNGLWLPEKHAPRSRGAVSAYRWGTLSSQDRELALADGWLPPAAGGAARTYGVWNGAQPTTAAIAKVTTGTAIKTMLQLQSGSAVGLRVIEWGVSFDTALATPAQVELIDTAAVAATVTAFAAADVVKMNGPNDAATTAVLGTTASGFTATAEGTITSGRLGDYQLVTQSYVKQFPLGREFEIPVSHNLRVRVTSGTAVNMICYLIYEE